MAGGLAQTEKGFEYGENASPLSELRHDVPLGGDANGVVYAALYFIEFDVKNRIRSRRQLRENLALHAPQDEWPNLRAQPDDGRLISIRDRPGVALLKVAS